MRLWNPLGWPVCLSLLFLALCGHAEAKPPDPLRLIPAEADFAVKVEQPRKLLEGILNLDVMARFQTLQPVQELLDSTNYRRLYQLLAYLERELGVSRWELLDRLAGGGVAVAGKFGPDNPPVLLVLQGTDPALQQRFFQTALNLAEQELARQEAKVRPEKGAYRNVPTVRVGNDFHAAVVGAAILLSNKEKGLHKGLDLHLDGGKAALAGLADVADARGILPKDPLVWSWISLKPAQQSRQGKDVFTQPRNDFILTVLFGGWLDVAGRAPFVALGLHQDRRGYRLAVRLPRGKDGMNPANALHVPLQGEPGALPPLEPKNVLYSTSFYFDFAQIWEQRQGLFNAEQNKTLEEFSKRAAPFLAGNQLSKLLTQAGARHRFVVAHQDKLPYETAPETRIPAFALVSEMREPEKLGKALEGMIRAAALLAGNQFKLKLAEEKYKGHMILAYRFPVDVKVNGDPSNLRFNFMPAFVRVGNQFVASSRLDLCRELIDLLEKEAKDPPRVVEQLTFRSRVYGAGGTALLKDFEDQLLTQTILGQALPPDAARQQVQTVLDLAGQLGVLRVDSRYRDNLFRTDIRWQPAK